MLRAYELAQSSKALIESDRCLWTPERQYPEVELAVHIPEGVENVAENWKIIQGNLRIVRSRWQWKTAAKPERQTWNPELNNGIGDWDTEGKASGADSVFSSRLPQPLRIDALKDSAAEHDVLMKLIIEPIAKQIDALKSTPGSALRTALEAVAESTKEPVAAYQEEINRVSEKVGQGITNVFPNLSIAIKVGINPPSLEASKALIDGSSIRFFEGQTDTGLRQQGAGSRRAMFWSLLQVRSEIERQRAIAEDQRKELEKLKAALDKEQKKQKPKQETIEGYVAQIAAKETGEIQEDATSFPGYILLIDEPENCLHPMAARAACKYLYDLAKDSDWQVMLSTHSPYFINPLEDHTTIVRLERSGRNTTPRTYRADSTEFSEDERENLRGLLQLDASLSEMFFGSYPILVEGDTEFAAYIAAISETGHDLSTQVAVVNARGKALLCPLVKLLKHFEVSFGILHDADSPLRSDGKKSSAWTENAKICAAICDARNSKLDVRHHVSVPDFERRLGLPEAEKDKPLSVYRVIRADVERKKHVVDLFEKLILSSDMQPFRCLDVSATALDVEASVAEYVADWAKQNATDDPRFVFPTQHRTGQVDTLYGA